uniref:hypothetical protein n=1 Tax=Paractinoplanes polyasparticus TaxID=2856853 RepID=UPI001C8581B4|nr:hypothetical protein [Actinoplanes polyasparticus]
MSNHERLITLRQRLGAEPAAAALRRRRPALRWVLGDYEVHPKGFNNFVGGKTAEALNE